MAERGNDNVSLNPFKIIILDENSETLLDEVLGAQLVAVAMDDDLVVWQGITGGVLMDNYSLDNLIE